MSHLCYLCLFAHSGVTYCVVFLFFFVLFTLCCPFLWLVLFWLPLQYSLTFIWACGSILSSNLELTTFALITGGTCTSTLLLIWACGSLCSRFSSLASGTDDGFFFFNLAKIDDSLSGNGGISSNTVALKIKMFKCNQWQQ